MIVEKLMTRDVRTCRPGDDLSVPARIMWENDCGCVPVVDGQSRVVAMITDRDICMAAYTRGRALREMSVQSAMSAGVQSCRPADDAKRAEELMRREQVRRLPVVDAAGKLAGILSLNDLACAAGPTRGTRDAQVTLEEVGLTLAAVCAHPRPTQAAAPAPVRRSPEVPAGAEI